MKLSLLVTAILLSPSSMAQPPNDLCANATMLTINGGRINGTLEGATLSSEEFDHPVCEDKNQIFGPNQDKTKESIWYSVVGSGAGVVASLCNSSATVVVYSDNCESPQCISVPRLDLDDYCPTDIAGTYTSWYALEGVTYKLRVQESSDPRPFLLGVFELNTLSSNDVCENARIIPSNGRVDDIYGESVSSIDLGYPTCGTASERNGATAGTTGLWYQMKGTGESIRVSAACGASLETGVRVFNGSCDALVCAGNHDARQNICGDGWDGQDVVSVDTEEGENYYILIENDRVPGDFYFLLEHSGQVGILGGVEGLSLATLTCTSVFLLVSFVVDIA